MNAWAGCCTASRYSVIWGYAMFRLPQRDQRGVVALHAPGGALLLHEAGERPGRSQLAQHADRRRIAIALRQEPMTERVGHAQQRRLLEPAEGPVGNEVVTEVHFIQERVVRRVGADQPRRPGELGGAGERKGRLYAIAVAEHRQAVADRQDLD